MKYDKTIAYFIQAFLLYSDVEASLVPVGGGGDEEEGHQEPLQKAEPPPALRSPPSRGARRADALQTAAEARPLAPHLQPDPTGPQWHRGGRERELVRLTWTEGGGCARPPCSKVQEHRIPLPATELGGTALVTTKTVKKGE